MVLAAPELVITQRVELLDEIEVAAELQHRMLADRMMRGEESTELEARHGVLSGISCSSVFVEASDPNYGLEGPKAITQNRRCCIVVVQIGAACRRPEFPAASG